MPGLFKTSNSALNARTFENREAVAGESMTLQGTVNKTGFLLFCAVATAAWTWWLARIGRILRDRGTPAEARPPTTLASAPGPKTRIRSDDR